MNKPADGKPGALQGIRVLDLTDVLAGPFATMQLCDMGAEVIKVEPPVGGQRGMGFKLKGEDGAAFLAINRGKRSFAIDLKSDAGRECFYKLVATADVMVENFRVGVTKRLKVDWDTLSRINPRLVYASISGFGQTGPYSDRPGYDVIAQGMSGVMSVTGAPDGPPAKCGLPIGDLSAGLFCANAILCALMARNTTGRGQYVDTSLYEALIALSVWESVEHWTTGAVPQRSGSAHRAFAPYQALRAKDGYFTLGAGGTDAFWQKLCGLIHREDLMTNPKFVTNAARLKARAELEVELEASFAEKTVAESVALMLSAGIPAGPIHTYDQSLTDPHTLARGMVQTIAHPVEGPMRVLGTPMKLSDTPAAVRGPAPLRGADTAALLAELGLRSDEIGKLSQAKVIHVGSPSGVSVRP